jgi:catalase-peroxidase
VRFEWEKQNSPGGGTVWVPTDKSAHTAVPDAHIEGKRNPPIMLTTDLSLKEDPGFRKIAKRFLKKPEQFDQAFAKAWFKLTHRDLGPRARYLGSEIPAEEFVSMIVEFKGFGSIFDHFGRGEKKKPP